MRKVILYGFLGVCALVFMALNVYASQVNYDSLMFRLIELDDVDAAREFLANLEGSGAGNSAVAGGKEAGEGVSVSGQTELYESQSRYLNSHFDNVFTREVDVNRLNTAKAIARYEDLRRISPKNPGLLVKLAILYRQQGDDSVAQKYYYEAKAIDPWIDVEGFE